MNKIYTGIVTLVALVALVSSTAYAAFTDQAQATGLALGTSTANLLIKDRNGDFHSTADFTGLKGVLAPGDTQETPFSLRNDGDIDLSLKIQLTAHNNATEGAWGNLKDEVKLNIYPATGSPSGPNATGWFTLAQFEANARSFGPTLTANGGEGNFIVAYTLGSGADSTIMGQTIDQIAFTITGTQAGGHVDE